jgi:ketosteroid isomerase-like protein
MEALVQEFYEAFSRLDAEAMAACYHPEVRFTDPAFGTLYGAHAGNMWRMLCASQKGKDFVVHYSNIRKEGKGVSAHWEASYTFSATGNKVVNRIDAYFEFESGKIIRHTDRFNLYRWSKQALGIKGYLIGWTSFFQRKLQQQTGRLLQQYEREQLA